MQIRCPTCGASTEVESRQAFLACESCDARLAVYRGFGQRHLLIPPSLSRDAVLQRFDAILTDHRVRTRPQRPEVIGELFPLWLLEEGTRTRVAPARASEHPALARLGLATAEARAFDVDHASGFEALPPTLPPTGVDPGDTVDLVHVPLWRVVFRMEGEDHEVLLDARTGEEVAYCGPSPEQDPARLGREMLACLALYTLLALALPGWIFLLVGLALAVWLSSGPAFLEELR